MDSSERTHCAQPSSSKTQSARIARLNDLLRRRACGGHILLTPGVTALGEERVITILKAVREFQDFSPLNDPYDEHDFGALKILDHKIFWKIDYYDLTMTCGSPDPANPNVTTRVITIMLANEY